jgi:hypothetical protein
MPHPIPEARVRSIRVLFRNVRLSNFIIIVSVRTVESKDGATPQDPVEFEESGF